MIQFQLENQSTYDLSAWGGIIFIIGINEKVNENRTRITSMELDVSGDVRELLTFSNAGKKMDLEKKKLIRL